MALSHELYLSALALALTNTVHGTKLNIQTRSIVAHAIKNGAANMLSQIDMILHMDMICPI